MATPEQLTQIQDVIKSALEESGVDSSTLSADQMKNISSALNKKLSSGASSSSEDGPGPIGFELDVQNTIPTDVMQTQAANLFNTETVPVAGLDLDNTFADLVNTQASIAKEFMSGNVPEDVAAQIKRSNLENSLIQGRGIGSQSTRNITARDLGLTSAAFMEKGVALAESTAKLLESRREFDKTYFQRSIELADSLRQTDLTAAELKEKHNQFQAEMNYKLRELVAQTIISGQQIVADYAKIPSEGHGVQPGEGLGRDIGALVKSLQGLL